jgi:protein-S-isoprenylcysteine O-methyltransferase Ste14
MSSVTNERGGARVRFPPPLVFLACIGAGVLLGRFVQPLVLPIPTAPRLAAGVLVIVAGLALVVWAFGPFRRTGQDPAPWKPSPSLIIQGPYKFTRNPMYVAMLTVQVGVGVCLGNVWILLLGPLALVLVHFIAVLPEEAYLGERFGEDYARYRASVRRYF